MTNILNTRLYNIEHALNLAIKDAAELRAYDEVAKLIYDYSDVTSGTLKTRHLAAFTYGLEDPAEFAELVRAVAYKLVKEAADLIEDAISTSSFYAGIAKCFARLDEGNATLALAVLIDLEGISAVAQAFEFAPVADAPVSI